MPQGDKVRLVSRDIPLPPSANSYPVPIAFSSTTLSKVHIPVLDDALFSGFGPTPDPRTDLAVDLLEWIGMASIGARRLFAADSCDPFVAIYDPPQPSVVGNLLCVTWNGFIPPAFITLVLSTARSMLKTLPGMSSGDKAGSIPHWGVLCVAGFDDAPVSWNNRDHGYLVNGDNHFATLFTAANQSLSFTMDGGPLPAE
ncbi:ribonuclease P 40kDa subunit-domain-containing protein [Entophlyctis helioformis]|nr:ribonuclease P 40kDa subunit-domain-containing protein [Entophlyctis helioformis]